MLRWSKIFKSLWWPTTVSRWSRFVVPATITTRPKPLCCPLLFFLHVSMCEMRMSFRLVTHYPPATLLPNGIFWGKKNSGDTHVIRTFGVWPKMSPKVVRKDLWVMAHKNRFPKSHPLRQVALFISCVNLQLRLELKRLAINYLYLYRTHACKYSVLMALCFFICFLYYMFTWFPNGH